MKDDQKRERLFDMVSKIRVAHDAYGEIQRELEMGYESVGFTPVPVCLLVTGETRTGKSCVVREMLRQHAARESESGDIKSVVYAVAPPSATLKGLLEALLKGLGDPLWSRGTVSNMTERLYVLLDKVSCRMIVLDEFQHLWPEGRKAGATVLSDWVKVLVEPGRWGIVAVGLPRSAAIIHTHRQLVSRFRPALRLPLFDWRVESSRLQFRGVLKGFRKQLAPFEFPVLESSELAYRMYLATAGRIGLIAALLDRAVKEAVWDKRMGISIEHLQRAYERSIWMAPHFPVSGGPFLAKFQDIAANQIPDAIRTMAEADVYADDSGEVQLYGGHALSAAVDASHSEAVQGDRPRTRGRVTQRAKSGRGRSLREIL